MNLSSIINFGNNPSAIAGHARTFLLAALVVINAIGVLLVVFRPRDTARQEISADTTNSVSATSTARQEINAAITNTVPVMNKNKTRKTISVLLEDITPAMQERNRSVKMGVEKDYGVVIDFVNARLDMPREVYEIIIRITNELSELGRTCRHDELESIANDVSTGINPVTLRSMKDYLVLEATIGKDTYVLKRMSKIPSIKAYDILITEFKSRYIIEALMTIKNGTNEWMIMEYVGPRIPISNANFTEEEIKLLVHDCLTGLYTIHGSGYYHNDLFARNIVYAKNDEGETVGFKIIDFDAFTVKHKGLMAPSKLYDEVKGVLGIVYDYLKYRVDTRPKDVGYMIFVDEDVDIFIEFGRVIFLEEDYLLAEFLMTAAGWVSRPATSATDLMMHQYVSGNESDLFGDKEWTDTKRIPSELSDS